LSCVAWVELALRKELVCQRMRRRMVLVVAFGIAGSLAAAPRMASAEGLFDFFFGGAQRPQARPAPPPQANFFADPFGLNQQQAPAPAPRVAGSGTAFCVRGCDGKYFQVTSRGNASLAQMCQAFCPASATKVFYGGTIDGASAGDGERYAGTENAFAYRKALRADCTGGIHADRLLSRPDRRRPCPARRDESGAGQRRHGCRQPAA
jgi:hypothetical protein